MKVTSKPISSPGRTEGFPAPLMLRFLRSNVGSRSRGRSRSSSMFVRKKNAVIESAQEPSSPKVTCMGQVRARRSSKNSASRSNRGLLAKRLPRWWLFRKMAHYFGKFHKFRSFRSLWRRWALFFRLACCRKIDFGLDSSKIESNKKSLDKANSDVVDVEDKDVGEEDKTVEGGGNKEGFFASAPPKNAFLLTRCRSAPYRSSSLASQFWGSPHVTTEQGNTEDEAKSGPEQPQEEREMEAPTLEIESNCRKLSLQEGRSEDNERNLGVPQEFDEKFNGRSHESHKFEEMSSRGGSVHPLILTRSKSEPARTGARLNPETNFRRH